MAKSKRFSVINGRVIGKSEDGKFYEIELAPGVVVEIDVDSVDRIEERVDPLTNQAVAALMLDSEKEISVKLKPKIQADVYREGGEAPFVFGGSPSTTFEPMQIDGLGVGAGDSSIMAAGVARGTQCMYATWTWSNRHFYGWVRDDGGGAGDIRWDD